MSYLLYLVSACEFRRLTATSALSGMTGKSSWWHVFLHFFLLLCCIETFGQLCLSPLLVTLLRLLCLLFGITLLIGVTLKLDRGAGELGVRGVGGHILLISAYLLGPV